MFKIGTKVNDIYTKEVYTIVRKSNDINFYIIEDKNGETIGKFEWELEKTNFVKYIFWRIKNGRK